MTRPKRAAQPQHLNAEVILFDEASQQGVRVARQSVQKVWLSMCLGSAVTLTFTVLARHLL